MGKEGRREEGKERKDGEREDGEEEKEGGRMGQRGKREGGRMGQREGGRERSIGRVIQDENTLVTE